MQDQMQTQRFERKYFLTERQAIQVRDYMKGYLVPDEFSAKELDFSYPVHSIYLDSKALDTYWATVHCEKSRYKLRVRFYDDLPQSPVFFEIKRRENECVLKQRAGVYRAAGTMLLHGQLPGRESLIKDTPSQFASLQRFCSLMQRLNARPTMLIAYSREAWMSPQGNAVRITIDRQVRGEPRRDANFSTKMGRPVFPFRKLHVLELKFTNRFPDWFNELVRHFDLTQIGAPKYCGSIMETGEDRVINYNPLIERMREEAEDFPRIEISESGNVETPYV